MRWGPTSCGGTPGGGSASRRGREGALTMAVTSAIAIAVGGAPRVPGDPLPAEQLRTLQSVEVEGGVREQAVFRIRMAVGQDATGDWASFGEQTFTPGTRLTIDARIGEQ